MRQIIEKSYSKLDIQTVTEQARRDPNGLVARSEAYYNTQLQSAAERIRENSGCKFILLCGPSASGKTTTAHKLMRRLIDAGLSVQVVSMDNFYTGIESYPVLPDGSRDMESIQALDLELLNERFEQLLNTGESMFPTFDFAAQHQNRDATPMTLGKNDVLIMEGIHALHPMVLAGIPRENIFRIYVSVRTQFVQQGRAVLVPKDIRLIRRMVRDYKFRNYLPQQTLSYWKHVVAGERVNIDLYRDDVDLKMDNTIDYEVCVWHSMLHELLESVNMEDYEEYPELERIFWGLRYFPDMDSGLIPQSSLLREFVGEMS